MSGWSNGFIDYNNDGWKDLYSANGDVDNLTTSLAPARHHVRKSGRQGVRRRFRRKWAEDFLRVGYQRGSAFADLNNDGFMDLVVTSLNERPRILMNSADNGNHWLLLELVGRRSESRRHRREGQAHHPVGPHALQPRDRLGRFHVVQRPRLHFGLGSVDG